MTEARDGLWQRIWRTFLSGLVTVLPVVITLYIVYWLLRQAESLFGAILKVVLPQGWYIPGMGLLLGVAVVMFVGAFLNAWVFNRLGRLAVGLLERIPVVKTIYSGLRDFFDFLGGGGGTRKGLQEVVSVELQPQVHLIGFVTDSEAGNNVEELARDDDDPLVSVFFPMGYQLGGYTLYLPASRLTSLDLSVEEAMRVVLTAGVNRPHKQTNGTG